MNSVGFFISLFLFRSLYFLDFFIHIFFTLISNAERNAATSQVYCFLGMMSSFKESGRDETVATLLPPSECPEDRKVEQSLLSNSKNLKGPGYRIKLILNNRHQKEMHAGGIQNFVAKSGILN